MKFHGITLEQGSKVSNLTVASGTAFPASPDEGELFFRSDADIRISGLYLYVNGTWDRVASTDSLTLPNGATLPGTANEADIFYLNTNDANEGVYVYRNTEWVQVASGGGSSTFTVTGDVTGTLDGGVDVLTLSNTGVTAGTYRSVTVDAKGRVSAGTNPTTLAGYGITDAQPLDADLTAIAALAGTGLLTRTGAGAFAQRSIAVSGSGLTISDGDGVAGNPTISSNATSLNTSSTLVFRDEAGNFAAGNITASLTGAASLNVLKAGDVMTGSLGVVAGTVTAPGLYFSGDTNTGMWSPTADQLAFSTNGTERLRFNASGAFGLAGANFGTAGQVLTSGGAAGVPTWTTPTTGTVTSVAVTGPTAGITVGGSPITSSGTITLTLANDLAALEALSASGLAVRTGTDTWAVRQVEVSGTGLSITNGTGVAGNPTISSNATDANTPSTVVARDASGNFAAGTITAALTGAASLNVLRAGDTMTGALGIVGGSASAPGLFLSGDTNTGLYAFGSDAIAVATDGTRRLVVNSLGQVVIGGTGAATATALNPTGNVIDVQGSFTLVRSSSDALGQFIEFTKSRGGAVVQTNDVLGRIMGEGFDGTSNLAGVELQMAVDGTPGTGEMPSRFAIFTRNTGDTNVVERFRVSRHGALGIGGANFGTSGQVLTSQGTNAPPVWATAPSGTVTSVAVSGSTGLTVGGSPITSSGTISLTLDTGLQNLASFATTGIVVASAADTWVSRSIAVSGSGLSVTNADGISGNPTVTSNATALNTASTLVFRDGSGNFAAGTITAALSGNATTATTLQTARNFSLTGDVTATAVSFNGSAPVALTTTLGTTTVAAGSYGSTTEVATFTVNAQGRLTLASNASIAFPVTSVAGRTGAIVLTTADIGGYGTVSDSVFTLQDNGDATKQARFEVSGISTATTRTFTLPNLDATLAHTGNAAQTFAGQTTFSNATLTFGNSTAASTTNVASGATTTGNTKTVNVGTGGAAGSTTIVNVGSANGTTINLAGEVLLAADPTQALGAATKQYVDNLASGLDMKASVRVATIGNITLSGTQTIDGVALVAGDRVLVKNQTTASQNGIYVVAAGAWSRAPDADNSPVGEVTSGLYVFVEEGSQTGNSGWVLGTANPITLGTTPLTFVQFTGLGQVTAGAGLTKSGNTLDIGTASTARIVVNADNIDLATVTDGGGGSFLKFTRDTYGRVSGTSAVAAGDITTALGYTPVNRAGDLMTGALGITAGTVTAPGLYFSGDTNTGLYSPGADAVGVTTAGTEVARFTTSNLLLGGTTAYTARQSSTVFTPLVQTAGTSVNASSLLLSYWNSNNAGTNLFFAKSRGAAAGTQTAVVADDILGNILFTGSDGTQFTEAARISAHAEGATATDSISGRLAFFTTSAGTAPTERFRIASTGAWGLSGANFGTSGQVLTSAGAGAPPTWTTISSGTVTSVAVSGTNGIGVSGSPITSSGTISLTLGAITPTSVSAGTISTTSQFLGNAADTATAPSFSWTGDTDLGMFRPATDTLAFTTAGTERLRITDAGAIFIGTTTALSGPGATRISMLGTNFSTSSSSYARFSADNDGAYLTFIKSRSATAHIYTIVQAGDALGRIQFRGADGTTSEFGAEISAIVDGTPAAGIIPTRIAFSTENAAGVAAERMRINSEGNVSIGGTPTSQRLFVGGNSTGAVSTTGILSAMAVQSDVTTSHNVFASFPSTAAAAFTLGSITHYSAAQSTIGAGSTLTEQVGFRAGSSLIGATNNYGFVGTLPEGTGRWNIFMNGTAPNFLQGSLGIGTSGVAGNKVIVGGALTGAGSYAAFGAAGTVQNDVTTSYNAFSSFPSTAAATFTLTALHHFNASQGTFGAGSGVTFQYGFRAQSSLVGADNNYGFVGELPSGAGRWNLFMPGSASNHLSGKLLNSSLLDLTVGAISSQVQINGTSATTSSLSITRSAADANGALIYLSKGRSTVGDASVAVVNDDILGTIFFGGTNTSAYTTGASIRGRAEGTWSGTSTPTRLEFITTSSGSTAQTERMRITGDGSVGIGTATLTGYNLRLGRSMTGAAFARNVYAGSNPLSDVTSGGSSFESVLTIPSGTAMSGTFVHFYAQQGAFTGSVNTQVGFRVDPNMIGASNLNLGFRGSIAASTGRYNVYMDGTAQNWFAGNVGIGAGKEEPAVALDVNGTVSASSGFNTATGSVTVNQATLSTTSTTVTTTALTTIDSVAATAVRSAKYLVQIHDTTNSHFHAVEILVIHNGTTVWESEYSEVVSNAPLGTFDAVISGGNLNLTFQATAATTKNIKVLRTALLT